ncbi:hypothetical protein FRC03_010950 [Tulasnella sp. 419]|nr:hypothetical protein FRC03_010950 [Tulasnella sp. 419]
MPQTLLKRIQAKTRRLLSRSSKQKDISSVPNIDTPASPLPPIFPQSQSTLSLSESTSDYESGEKEGDVVAIENFWVIPTEIKLIILEYLRGNLHLLSILCRANKFFNALVTPIMYSNVDLRSGLHGPYALHRHNSYLTTTGKHPKYLTRVRHLGWEFATSGWNVFPLMTNIQSLDITMNDASIGPENIVPVFPNLRKARLSGKFYIGSLECILLTSPFLEELHLVGGMGEVENNGAMTSEIIPFLDLCSSNPGKMPNLKTLTLSRGQSEHKWYAIEEPEPALECWARFLRHYANQLEDLTLELEGENYYTLINADRARNAFTQHIVPLLKSGTFKRLQRIDLLRAARLTPEDGAQIKQALPSDADLMWTPDYQSAVRTLLSEFFIVSHMT